MKPGLRSSLQVLIAWHPSFDQGSTLADKLVLELTRDPNDPSTRGIGLPVFFHQDSLEPPPSAERVEDFDLDDCEKSAAVLLLDDNFVAGDRWEDFASRLLTTSAASSGRLLLIPVALSQHAHKSAAATRQAIRLADTPIDEVCEQLVFELTHELCRFLVGMPRPSNGKGQPSHAPVRVFISHAKRDGEGLAREVRNFLASTQLDAFFDTTDIAPGYDFEKELHGAIQTAAILVIQTDAYGSREWCKREVLWAKQHGRPIVVVNAVSRGERRMFPYLGNVPSIRWDGTPGIHRRAVGLLLHEVLRSLAFENMRWNRTVEDSVLVLPRPPELVNLAAGQLRGNDSSMVLYPDPPLADDEIDLLAQFAPKAIFVTPTTLRGAMKRRQSPLKGCRIGLSISDCDDMKRRGLAKVHLDDAFVELARHLLALGAKLAYGGDLRKGGYTESLYGLVRDHGRAGGSSWERIRSYLAWPDGDQLPAATQAAYKQEAEFIVVPRPDALQDTEPDEGGWIRAAALSAMRQRMTRDIDAWIVLGGRLQGFQGFLPGVVEEAWLAAESSRPLYVLGGFGGAAGAMASLLRGQSHAILETELTAPPALVQQRRARASAAGIPVVNGTLVIERLRQGDLPSNGLDAQSNGRLLLTRDTAEAVELTVQGLLALFEGDNGDGANL